ncbi:uncharacterized protein RMCFA_1714 [Mycolicibacterium fortuitum subsp. acetamidolyticum]|uniref:DUF732 domain-containing protein n=3 Tax=Mycolicibacterium fortuitum TaxID=1766 RepID=A0A100WNQ7_MYCFO|nr:hypothetical protein [Mycolicibacterium fortuitum]MCV7143092.1 hypothetical protein [Mycolicibacterium fortuitum]GAT01602.1 uncharacterized protein RMCFA_1714 [Mycolicibacterium fortuitum subsp. acetamidolyticum]
MSGKCGLLATPTAIALAVGVAPTAPSEPNTPYWNGVYEGQGAMVSYANQVGWALPILSSSWSGTDRINLCDNLFADRYPEYQGPPWRTKAEVDAASYRGGFIAGCVYTSLGKTPG